MKYAALLLLPLLGCATEPAPFVPGTLKVLGFECDDHGVNAIRVLSDGVNISTVSWDNKDVCGDPT